jgi:hypothetical protein
LAPGHIGGYRVRLKSIAVLNQIGESHFVANENLSPNVSYPLFMSLPNDASLGSSIVDVMQKSVVALEIRDLRILP